MCFALAQRSIATRAFAAGSAAWNANSLRSEASFPGFSTSGQGISRMQGEAPSIVECGSWRMLRSRRSAKRCRNGFSLIKCFASASPTQNGDTTAEITSRQSGIPRSENFLNESASSFRVSNLPSYQSGDHRISKSTNQGRQGITASTKSSCKRPAQKVSALAEPGSGGNGNRSTTQGRGESDRLPRNRHRRVRLDAANEKRKTSV